MIKNEKFLLLASSSTHYVMKLEKLLQNSEIWCRIIPLPSEISAGCGLSIRVEVSDLEKIDSLIKSENLQVEKFIVEKIGLKKIVQKL